MPRAQCPRLFVCSKRVLASRRIRYHRRVIIKWFLALSFGCVIGSAATIEGVVRLPAAKVADTPASTGRYQIKASTKPADPEPIQAVVYLEGTFTENSAPAKVEVGQRKFQFIPGLLPIQKGATVEFPNYDDDYHNVFSYSKSKKFDLGRYRKDEKPPSQVFDKPGVVKLFCEIHEHMRSTILVLDTPYFVKTDTTGRYKLEKLPAGKYTLKAWLDEKQVLEKPIELKEGDALTIDF